MKKSLLIALVAVCAASTAFAQNVPVGGSISAYADMEGTNCLITIPSPPAVTTFYVVHIPAPGECVTGGTFAMPYPPCLTAVVTMFPFAPNGATPPGTDVQTGISIGYGSNQTNPFMSGSQGFFPFGVPLADCCLVSVQDGNAGFEVAATNCQVPILDVPAQGGGGVVNDVATPTCTCNVDNEESTWGGIKDLFGAE
jgi:hypothetical protein